MRQALLTRLERLEQRATDGVGDSDTGRRGVVRYC